MPPELHAAVRASAAAHERSWGGEVRAIVKAHLAQSAPARPVADAERMSVADAHAAIEVTGEKPREAEGARAAAADEVDGAFADVGSSSQSTQPCEVEQAPDHLGSRVLSA
jgi:plasmid stability protein